MAKTTQQFDMALAAKVEMSAADESAILNAMLAGMDGDEIVESDDQMLALTAEIERVELQSPQDDGDEIMAIAADIEKAEAISAVYAHDDSVIEGGVIVSEADTPKTEVAALDAKPKKEKKAKVAKAPKEPKAAKEPKEPRFTRQAAHGVESRVLTARLGAKAGEFLVLEVADASLDGEALAAKQAEILALVDSSAKKIQLKCTKLFGWMANGGKLNEVLAITFATLVKEGQLTSGLKGNLQAALTAKYSTATSISQVNQLFQMLPSLKVTIKEKGRMTPNPESLILMKVSAELGLA